jgi:hypothetical protein
MGVGMGNIQYKIWGWGPETYEGRNIQFNVGVSTKAKRSEDNSYEIANEMLCLRLAHALKLPVPSGGVIKKDDQLYFASLVFSLAEETLPKPTWSDIQAIVANDPWLACGIVVFDSWICNDDRHRGNIRYNRESQQAILIDHGSSPFYGSSPEKAEAELESFRDKLVVNHNTHCLAAKITSLSDFAEWHSRIKAIPDYFIRETVHESVELGLPESQEEFLSDYLLKRRERLKLIFEADYKTAFPKLIPQATLFDAHPFEFVRGDFDFDI